MITVTPGRGDAKSAKVFMVVSFTAETQTLLPNAVGAAPCICPV